MNSNVGGNNGSGGAGLFIVGEKDDWRYGVLAQNLFSNVSDTGSMQLLQNAIDWLLDDYSTSKTINVVSVQLPGIETWWFRHNERLREWLTAYYPERHTINEANTCDYEALDACIDTHSPDLIIFGDNNPDGGGYASVEPGVNKAITQKIPFIVMHYNRDPSPMTATLLSAMQVTAANNYWTKHRIENFTITDEFKTQDVSFDSVRDLITRLRNDDFDTAILQSCDNNYWNCDATDFMNAFKTGANKLKTMMKSFDQNAVDVFKVDEPIAQIALLLGDKYRSQIDYPILESEHNAYLEALYADWVVSYARENNIAADLGEHIVETTEVVKGENAHYAYPNTISSETRTFEVDFDDHGRQQVGMPCQEYQLH